MTKHFSHIPAGSRKSLVLGILAVLWTALIFGWYYAGHKPFTTNLALAVSQLIFRILVVIWIFSLSGGVGRRILRKIAIGDGLTGSGLRITLEASLGLGLFAIVVLLIGSLLSITALRWVNLILFLFLFWLWSDIRGWWQEWRCAWIDFQPQNGLEKVIAAGSGIILLLTLVIALAPPLKFDALVYHLALPHQYLVENRINYQPGLLFWGMPQLSEMIFTWAMALADIQAAALAGWAAAFLSLVGLFAFTSNRWGKMAAWAAVAAMLSGYTLAVSIAWAYVDWIAALYGLCVLAILDEWRLQRKPVILIFAGAFAGLALGVKYTAGVSLLSGMALIIWIIQSTASRSRRHRPLLAATSLYGITAVIVSLPWWLKNLLTTGNPFYPFFVPSGSMDEVRQRLYIGEGITSSWMDALFLPLRATVNGFEGSTGFSASIGPVLLVLAPLSLVWLLSLAQSTQFDAEHPSDQDISCKREAAITTLIYCLFGTIIWALASRYADFLLQTRLFLGIFPAVAALSGAGLSALNSLHLPQVRVSRVLGAMVGFALWLNLVQVGQTVLTSGALNVILGIEDQNAYLRRNLGMYAVAMEAVRELPEEARVLMVWETRGLYCQPDPGKSGPTCESDEVIDRWPHAMAIYGSPERILKEWQTQGYTHLLFYGLGAEFLTSEDPRLSPEEREAMNIFISSLPLLEDFNDVYTLYSLVP